MARYLRSLATGVVLPYIANTVKAGGVVELSPSEVEEYEATLNNKKVRRAPTKAKVRSKAKVEAAKTAEPALGETVVEDFVPSADEVLKAIGDS